MMRRAAWLVMAVMASHGARGAEITDATGRSVAIPEHVTRVLPAGPPAAVLLEALAPDLMIGWPHPLSAAQRAMLPDAVAALPPVPMLTGKTDQVARVPALHPDLVLDYGTVSPRYVALDEAIQQRTGVPTILLDGSLSRAPEMLLALGAVLHREARAAVLARVVRQVIDAVPRRPGRATTVVYARGADGLDLVAPGTGATEAFAVLGWTVLGPPGDGPVRRVRGIGAVAALDPDVVVFEDQGMRAVVSADASWRALRAVRDGRAFVAPALPFGWFGEPPSINRLFGVAAFENAATVGPLIAALVGRMPGTPPQLQPITP